MAFHTDARISAEKYNWHKETVNITESKEQNNFSETNPK